MIFKGEETHKVHIRPLDPVVQDFQDFIEGDAEVLMYFNQMIDQAPPPKNEDQRRVHLVYTLWFTPLIVA